MSINLKSLREKAGFTQQELSKKTGFSVGSISYMENSNHPPNLSNIEKYLNGLGLEIELSVKHPNIETMIIEWAKAKGIFTCSSVFSQVEKLEEEILELKAVVEAGENSNAIDKLGDVLVVAVNLSKMLDTDIKSCLQLAYNKIKDRTGKMVSGKFVKD
jgi:transcriptional regulator with XRE-family HTH domain